MSQQGDARGLSGRALALARRKAMSGAGKAALQASAAVTSPGAGLTASTPAVSATRCPSPSTVSSAGAAAGGRAASVARRQAMSQRGKVAVTSRDRVRNGQTKSVAVAPLGGEEQISVGKDCGCGCKGEGRAENVAEASPQHAASRAVVRGRVRGNRRPDFASNPGRAASLARRRAQSARGKAGMSASGMTAAQTARASNPELSGRELAQALREQRSRRGNAGQKKSEPTGRKRPGRSRNTGAAQDAAWKVGASETSHGQTVTGTMVGRSASVTGDEPSTCRTVTGTEYMGADIFRDFCQADPAKGVRRAGSSPTSRGNTVTGNELGRSAKVTGDEPGTCKRVTGSEYIGADQAEAFCGTRAEPGPARSTGSETRKGKQVSGNNVGRSKNVTGDETGANRVLTGTQYMAPGEAGGPSKVGASATLRGSTVTGTMVGHGQRMTGDEPGSCRNVTGDDYVGQEQYRNFCPATPAPVDRKVGESKTFAGERVTGTLTGRSGRVTGDEPGTCKSITGTPYAGVEQYKDYCEAPQSEAASARMQRSQRMFGKSMTGLQPAVGGKMTGDARGACEPVSGTPYVGADQAAAACPANAAEPGSPDFPQPIGDTPWGRFSVTPPVHAADAPRELGGVTGAYYEQGQVTGPFGMAPGKVTGTEEARFGRSAPTAPTAVPADAALIDGRVKTRITGEGIDAGHKITGDDWDRGDRVTGTEGASAMRRNPTRRGNTNASMATRLVDSRHDEAPAPVSKVTGGSGNTDKGAMITYSGGARG